MEGDGRVLEIPDPGRHIVCRFKAAQAEVLPGAKRPPQVWVPLGPGEDSFGQHFDFRSFCRLLLSLVPKLLQM